MSGARPTRAPAPRWTTRRRSSTWRAIYLVVLGALAAEIVAGARAGARSR